MRMGLHFCEADTPPLQSEETTDKSEIYQDFVKLEKHGIIIKTEDFVKLEKLSRIRETEEFNEEFEEMNV